MSNFLADVLGLLGNDAVSEFNVRSGPGTNFAAMSFKAQKGWAGMTILDVQTDSQNTPNQADTNRVYQWFKVNFPNGQTGWLRGHVVGIHGDGSAWGYSSSATPTHAYTLTRDTSKTGPTETTTSAPAVTTAPTITPQQPQQPVTTTPVITPQQPTTPEPATTTKVGTPAPEQPVTTTTKAGTPTPTETVAEKDSPKCVATVTASPSAKMRAQPVNGDQVGSAVSGAILPILEKQDASDGYKWLKIDNSGVVGWVREDLMSYSGDCAEFGLQVTSTTASKVISFTDYESADLYPVPMNNSRFVRGFTGHQPNHPGVDYGANDGEAMFAGPAGGLVVVTTPCTKCTDAKPSTMDHGLSIGDSSIFSDPAWGYGYGNYVTIRYLHDQLPQATKDALAQLGFAGNHIYALYGHMKDYSVQKGQVLEAGQQIGRCGNTGNSHGAHLHLEIRASSNSNYVSWSQMANGLLDPLIMFQK